MISFTVAAGDLFSLELFVVMSAGVCDGGWPAGGHSTQRHHHRGNADPGHGLQQQGTELTAA